MFHLSKCRTSNVPMFQISLQELQTSRPRPQIVPMLLKLSSSTVCLNFFIYITFICYIIITFLYLHFLLMNYIISILHNILLMFVFTLLAILNFYNKLRYLISRSICETLLTLSLSEHQHCMVFLASLFLATLIEVMG